MIKYFYSYLDQVFIVHEGGKGIETLIYRSEVKEKYPISVLDQCYEGMPIEWD